MTRLLALTAAAVLLVPSGLAAQGHPDFSGTWTLDEARSDPPPPPGSPRGARRGVIATPSKLVITQAGAELAIASTLGDQTLTTIYKLDGRESLNRQPRGELKTRSRWDEGRLITEGTRSVETPEGSRELQVKEIRSLGPDGRTLIIESTTETPMGSFTRKLVFRRSPQTN